MEHASLVAGYALLAAAGMLHRRPDELQLTSLLAASGLGVTSENALSWSATVEP